ncbi:TPA: hypothetical protein HA244_04445 [Candidatus Micrarchaeota archaeon]|nr:hypothetical protein [Candidatus Micrarchaeota archaeon]
MDRVKLTRYGIIVIIAFFALEFFWPLLYSPTAQPTPTPTVEPEIQNQALNATAVLKSKGNRMLLLCDTRPSESNGTSQQELKAQLQALPGVTRVIQSSSIYDVAFAPATQNSTATNTTATPPTAAVESLEITIATVFYAACPSGIAYTRANELEFASALSLNTSQGPRPIRLPASTCTQANWQCLIFPTMQENQTLNVLVEIKSDANGEQGTIRQVPPIVEVQPANNTMVAQTPANSSAEGQNSSQTAATPKSNSTP